MKKRTLTLISLLLLLIFVISIFPSCSDKNQPEETTAAAGENDTTAAETESLYDANGYLKDKMGNYDFNQRDVTVFYWSDCIINEFNSEGLNGDIVSDANYNRNCKVEERCNIKFKYITEPGNSDHRSTYITKLKTLINSDDTAVDIVGSYSMCAGAAAVDGLCTDMLASDKFEWDMPWWPDTAVSVSKINGKLFFVSGDISLCNTLAMVATYFNKTIVEDRSLEDPYTLFANDQWTLDKMWEMSKGVYEDTNQNATADLGDKFGLLMPQSSIDTLVIASGVTMLINQNDTLELNPDFIGERGAEVIAKLAAYVGDKTSVLTSKNSTEVRDSFAEGKSLFFISNCSTATYLNDSELKFGLLCAPKITADQSDYHTSLTWTYTLFSIPYNQQDVECISTVMEILASESYRTTIPALYDNALKCRYVQDEKASEMFDFIRSKILYDAGRVFTINFDYPNNTIRPAVLNNTSWTVAIKGSKKIWKSQLEAILAAFE